jgi:preflagellin peptidase FlaK
MPWPAIFFLISLIGLIIASYTDITQRIVKNKLSYSLIGIGLAGHLVWAVLESNPIIFVYSAVSAAFGFSFAYFLWKIGVWAGGDVKLFAALAALNPINPYILGFFGFSLGEISNVVQLPLFPISIFIFSVFAMAPYGILISLHGLLKRKNERDKLVKDAIQKVWQTIQLAMAIVGISWSLTFFAITQWLIIPALIIFGLVKNSKARLGLAIAIFAVATFNAPAESIVGFAATSATLFGIYILIKLYSVSKTMLRKEKKITELEEGEIVADTFTEIDGKVERCAPLEIKRIINYFTNNKVQALREYLNPPGRIIASSRNARGLTDEEILELRRLVKENKLENAVVIKLSAPFVPALLIAYLALNIVGDLLWGLIF